MQEVGEVQEGGEEQEEVTWMEAWSLAPRILFEALHFLGMYMSTYSPASFCILATRLRL